MEREKGMERRQRGGGVCCQSDGEIKEAESRRKNKRWTGPTEQSE